VLTDAPVSFPSFFSEKARLQNIADNQKLLDSLKLGSGSTSALGKRAAPAAPVDKAKKKKKKVEPTEKVIIEPKRRSARVLGLEADSETLKRKYEVSLGFSSSFGVTTVDQEDAAKGRTRSDKGSNFYLPHVLTSSLRLHLLHL
jgi:hypothetical protein